MRLIASAVLILQAVHIAGAQTNFQIERRCRWACSLSKAKYTLRDWSDGNTVCRAMPRCVMWWAIPTATTRAKRDIQTRSRSAVRSLSRIRETG